MLETHPALHVVNISLFSTLTYGVGVYAYLQEWCSSLDISSTHISFPSKTTTYSFFDILCW